MLMKVENNKINGRWTDEFRRAVCDKYGAGSTAEVAKMLGLTKGVVTGIWDRGFEAGIIVRVARTNKQTGADSGRAVKVLKAKCPDAPPPKPKTRAQSEAEKRRARLAAQIVCEPVGLMDAKEHHCRHVIGRGDDGLALFCGARKEAGLSWCAGHAAIVFEAPANLPPSLQLRKIMKASRNA
jgi:hypothetical protein